VYHLATHYRYNSGLTEDSLIRGGAMVAVAAVLGFVLGCLAGWWVGRTVLMAQIHNAWEPPPRAEVEVTEVTEVTKAAELKKHAHG
jgi:hypothetical protein